jgi:D-3-phosphoglycerate dehydrogenase / 2-oxoglutarate reductase
MKALLLEGIHREAAAAFLDAGFDISQSRSSPPIEEVVEKMTDTSVLCIRSRTRVGENVLDASKGLLAVGAFCIGTEHIDVELCGKRGVAVFNAPYSNTRSVVELALGEMIMLLRNVFDRSTDLHAGRWGKSAEGSREIRGKRLGIVGYGNIGSQLSVLAESLGMEVVYHDVAEKLSLGNARKVSFEELLRTADVVTLHVDGRPGNRGFFGEREIAAMKHGAVFMNLSRGFVVDAEALAAALTSKKLAGAAIDVFPKEPSSNSEAFKSPLQGMRNCILTPHVGGSTEEAQQNIGRFVAARILDYIQTGSTSASVNLPVIQPGEKKGTHRFTHIHENVPGMMASINELFAKGGVNITGQHLETRGAIGYAIIDVDDDKGPALAGKIAALPGTIRSRMVY